MPGGIRGWILFRSKEYAPGPEESVRGSLGPPDPPENDTKKGECAPFGIPRGKTGEQVPAASAGAALSEAENVEREAGQTRVSPDL